MNEGEIGSERQWGDWLGGCGNGQDKRWCRLNGDSVDGERSILFEEALGGRNLGLLKESAREKEGEVRMAPRFLALVTDGCRAVRLRRMEWDVWLPVS